MSILKEFLRSTYKKIFVFIIVCQVLVLILVLEGLVIIFVLVFQSLLTSLADWGTIYPVVLLAIFVAVLDDSPVCMIARVRFDVVIL